VDQTGSRADQPAQGLTQKSDQGLKNGDCRMQSPFFLFPSSFICIHLYCMCGLSKVFCEKLFCRGKAAGLFVSVSWEAARCLAPAATLSVSCKLLQSPISNLQSPIPSPQSPVPSLSPFPQQCHPIVRQNRMFFEAAMLMFLWHIGCSLNNVRSFRRETCRVIKM
jgi:hypothetical protein